MFQNNIFAKISKIIFCILLILLQITPSDKPLLDDHDDKKYGTTTATTNKTATKVVALLETDYEQNVEELVKSRRCLSRVTSCTKILGNTFLYIGTGCSMVAAAFTAVGSQEMANNILFFGATCSAIHITFIGFARCSSKEEKKRDDLLAHLGEEVGFKVIPMDTQVTDDAEDNAEKGNTKK